MSCDSGEMCGHYTQVVWEGSTRVGCAIVECDDVSGLNWGVTSTMVICQYYEPGNYIGYKPYTYGNVGEDCDSMDDNYQSLCNNNNEICGENNRCTAIQTCSSNELLNGYDINYVCEDQDTGCSWNLLHNNKQVRMPYDGYNGMADDNGWKYCYGDLEEMK